MVKQQKKDFGEIKRPRLDVPRIYSTVLNKKYLMKFDDIFSILDEYLILRSLSSYSSKEILLSLKITFCDIFHKTLEANGDSLLGKEGNKQNG